MICPKCNKEKDKFSSFNPKICFECFHNTDAKHKYLDYLEKKSKLKSNQFPIKH